LVRLRRAQACFRSTSLVTAEGHGCGLTLRSSRPAPARQPGRQRRSSMLPLSAGPPYLHGRLSSNVRRLEVTFRSVGGYSLRSDLIWRRFPTSGAKRSRTHTQLVATIDLPQTSSQSCDQTVAWRTSMKNSRTGLGLVKIGVVALLIAIAGMAQAGSGVGSGGTGKTTSASTAGDPALNGLGGFLLYVRSLLSK
jgi:hypothetical protein